VNILFAGWQRSRPVTARPDEFRQLKRRRKGCRPHGYGDDQFVNNRGDTRRERRFRGDAIDPPLRLAASAWIWRDPLQQTTRLD
jgi:hypothetical protein